MPKLKPRKELLQKKIALCNRIPHDTFCLPPTFCISIVSKFFLVVTVVPREVEDNAYAKSKRANKVYGIAKLANVVLFYHNYSMF